MIFIDYKYFQTNQPAVFCFHLQHSEIFVFKTQVSLIASSCDQNDLINFHEISNWLINTDEWFSDQNRHFIFGFINQSAYACLMLSDQVDHSRLSLWQLSLFQSLWFTSGRFRGFGMKAIATSLWRRGCDFMFENTYHFRCRWVQIISQFGFDTDHDSDIEYQKCDEIGFHCSILLIFMWYNKIEFFLKFSSHSEIEMHFIASRMTIDTAD